MKKTTLLFFTFLFSISAFSQKGKTKTTEQPAIKQQIISSINSKYTTYKEEALQIWNFAEMGYKEQKSSALLQQTLKENGFNLEAGVAEIPTAFVASYGSGSPVIGILA